MDLKKVTAEATKVREEEIRKRTEYAATEGNTKATLAYEVFIEYKKIRATWRKINFYLKKYFTGPFVQLCVNTPNSITSEYDTIVSKLKDNKLSILIDYILLIHSYLTLIT